MKTRFAVEESRSLEIIANHATARAKSNRQDGSALYGAIREVDDTLPAFAHTIACF